VRGGGKAAKPAGKTGRQGRAVRPPHNCDITDAALLPSNQIEVKLLIDVAFGVMGNLDEKTAA
jgi:hypothetical protein